MLTASVAPGKGQGQRRSDVKRRTFLKAAIVSVVVGMSDPLPSGLRSIFRRLKDGTWKRVRMRQLKPGDQFAIEGLFTICEARSKPYKTAGGEWGIEAECGPLQGFDPESDQDWWKYLPTLLAG